MRFIAAAPSLARQSTIGHRVVGLAFTLALLPSVSVAQPAPFVGGGFAAGSGVRFDVPQVAKAFVVEQPQTDGGDLSISIELTTSVIVDSLVAPKIDQLLVEIMPRGGTAIVTDYAPRTELGSEYTGGIEVHRTDELNRSVAMAIDGRYPPVAGGSVTASRGEKNIESLKYQRVAPMHLIAASGTTRRGRGVYFKFRSTDQQIIEGDRVLQITLRVPATWRGELLEVMMVGDSHRTGFSSGVASLTGWSNKPLRVGTGRFLVAAYRADCPEARQAARRLADTEAEMRGHMHRVASGQREISDPAALLRHVSRRIDWNDPFDRGLAEKATLSLHRALEGSLDPYTDRAFKDLPVDTRAACLDYLAARKMFERLSVLAVQPPKNDLATITPAEAMTVATTP